MTYAAEGNRATAHRIVHAHNVFNALIAEAAGCSTEQADRIASLYLKNKIAKLDAVNGKISVKHGAFWDRAVLLRALEA